MCWSSTRRFTEGYITTPDFPSVPPDQLYDCTCQLRPDVPSTNGMEVYVIVMYVRLAEPEECAEETWVEDQVKWSRVTNKMTSQWAPWRLKSPASRLFAQPCVQAPIKENIKAPRHWYLWANPPVTGGFASQSASNAENVSIWWRHHVWRRIIWVSYKALESMDPIFATLHQGQWWWALVLYVTETLHKTKNISPVWVKNDAEHDWW